MDTNSLEQIVLRYIEKESKALSAEGVAIVGSFVSGEYGPGSDIDVFFLVERTDFEMSLIEFEGVIFDRMICAFDMMMEVLTSQCAVSDVFSLSLGGPSKLIEDTPALRAIVTLARNNIRRRGLCYKRLRVSRPKTVDGTRLTLEKNGDRFRLLRNGVLLL